MIELRPLTDSDLEFLLEIRNDDSTRNNLENNSIFTLEDCEKWFETLNYPWYIIKIDEVSVGYIRTNGIEIGCDIHPNHRRNGYAREAYKLILKEMDIASLWVFDDNFAKILYESLGFVKSGESKKIRNRNYIQMLWKKII
jgi:RimJ/RimL family protein N-acetyltransferase